MAPKKTTGKGKPAITKEEKAKEKGLTVAQYEERVKYTSAQRVFANLYVKTNATGVSSATKRAQVFRDAWTKAREATLASKTGELGTMTLAEKKKYFKALGVNID